MEYLFSPWRKTYLDRDRTHEDCAFCSALELPDSPQNLIVHRGEKSFVILNLFPYTSGHLMSVPYDHCEDLTQLNPQTLLEMMQLAQKAVSVLQGLYHPQGFNLGMNLGAVAGAGIAQHLHLHVVPRWGGDANFMSVIGETRVLPETLAETYARIRQAWEG